MAWTLTSKSDIFGEFLYEYHTSIGINIFLRCLAHIINLATQALISTRSKAKYFNPHDDGDQLPDANIVDVERDEVGLVRVICVKVRLLLMTPTYNAIIYYSYRHVRHRRGRSSSPLSKLNWRKKCSSSSSIWRFAGVQHILCCIGLSPIWRFVINCLPTLLVILIFCRLLTSSSTS